MTKIAIIGSGLTALSIANLLKQKADITLFEKARGVSGRMSTRRATPYVFDHGAQYFTARTKAFQTFIQPLISQGIIARWNARCIKLDDSQTAEYLDWLHDEPRYVGVPAMNSVTKYLAQGLTVHLNTKIVALEYDNTWHLLDENGQTYKGFDWVISTLPSPQAAALLPETFKYHADIDNHDMQACFALMLGFEEALSLPFDAAQVANADISWIAVNNQKPGRSHPYSLTIHSSAAYAEQHIDNNRDKVMQHLLDEASRFVGQDLHRATYKTLHGWRYASNVKRDPTPLFLDDQLKLAACGDWCSGGRVEGAFTSAYQLATALEETVL
ncbi:NADP transhydrogenase subunit alpha [Marinomonas agarivorans]|nr:NADP transhydrogenase subunit alpha [Marinomonas agarivorans]